MIPYILHTGVILTCCLIFYKLLLQKETFFQLNRYVLLACLALSFSLPLLPIPQQFSLRKEEPAFSANIPESVYTPNAVTVQPLPPDQTTSFNQQGENTDISLSQVVVWMIWLYWFGVAAFTITFFIQVFTLLARVYAYPVIKDGRFTIVELPGDKAPCSFGNLIFINPEKYDWDTYNQILLHEKIHIQQKHSFDILLAEIVLIFQWFNPFAWLYRKELENNLEFLTDDLMLTEGKVDRTSYQMNLLKVSAPHFPLSLTTNYNQSLLKKRVIMMTAKKSNINTTYKYLFLLPVLIMSVCLLNKPMASAQLSSAKKSMNKEHQQHNSQMKTEGAWFATIKNDKISIQFKNDGDDPNSFNSSTFSISELKDFQKEKPGTFTMTREAGTMQFTGKFEGDQGMGNYKFTTDKSFTDYLHNEGVATNDDEDIMVFFMVDLKKSVVQSLKENGYTRFTKNDLIPIAALNIDGEYIKSLKGAGIDNVSLQDLIPLKSLGVTGDYIREVKKADYPNVSASQLITFKAQGIDGKYLADIRHAAGKESKSEPNANSSANAKASTNSKTSANSKASNNSKASVSDDKSTADDNDDQNIDDIIAIKALNIDADYIRSLKEVGYDNLANGDLIAMKAQGITADYISSLQKMGYKNISASDLIGIKAQNITQDFIKSFENIGYTNISMQDMVPLKALGVTAGYVKSFKDIGFKDLSLDDAVSLKAQGITPALIQQYKNLGFANVSLDDIRGAKATGTTPSFINSMKEKGHNLKSLEKYIQLKVLVE